jgi:hypothetical protein
MKKTRIMWGIAIIVAALLLMLDFFGVASGLLEGVAVWKILLAVLFLFSAINEIIKLKFHGAIIPLAFIIILFEKEIALLCGIENGDIASHWEIFLVAVLLTIGLELLIPKKRKWRVKNGHRGNKTVYIDCSGNLGERVENNLGFCEVYFTSVEMYNGSGRLSIENNLGRIDIHIPEQWQASVNIENNLGSVDAPPPVNKG